VDRLKSRVFNRRRFVALGRLDAGSDLSSVIVAARKEKVWALALSGS